ncbi:MAG: PD-(D/E)XK nuclease family transposase, partial [Magnetococcales bacterium]|nr:PD-(D/E)XK nuclease family transposase [Magnetococcales bacterium]
RIPAYVIIIASFVTITDFILFPDFDHCTSRHESCETITKNIYLNDIVHYFIELPKFKKTLDACCGILEKWIYFIRYAESLDRVPEQLDLPPFRHAFEKAMMANMTQEELELYDKAGIAIADARGRVKLARREGREEGREEGLEKGLEKGREEGRQEEAVTMLRRQLRKKFGSFLNAEVESRLSAATLHKLEEWMDRILDAKSLDDVFFGQAVT